MNIEMKPTTPVDDHEAEMARADLYKMAKYSMKLFQMIQEGQELEGWVQSKITKASDYISSIYHYMEYQIKFGNGISSNRVSDITSEANPMRQEVAEEDDDENMEESMNYEQKLKALLEGAMKKEMKKKPAKKEVKTDEALDMNLIKAAQKGQAGKSIGKPDAESDKNIKKKYGYRSDGEPSEKEDEVGKQDRPGRKRKTKEDIEIEEATGDYSAKKARAGKDIGKPGKQFSKIAKKAGEKYGSKERGEKVAGAALKKLRAKESMVKDVVKRVVEAKKKGSKPDFLDLDKDGDKKEPMKKAVDDKKKGAVKESKDLNDLLKLAGRKPLY
jgi:hypothetical protein